MGSYAAHLTGPHPQVGTYQMVERAGQGVHSQRVVWSGLLGWSSLLDHPDRSDLTVGPIRMGERAGTGCPSQRVVWLVGWMG